MRSFKPYAILFGLLSVNSQLVGNTFDPSSYIEAKELTGATVNDRVTAKSIYRINGLRYQKLTSSAGSVFLPSTGAKPDLLEGGVLCQPHLKLMNEVVPVRENLPVEADILKDETAILELIRKCKEGMIKGPTLVIENPDGSQVEVKSKSDKDNRRSGGSATPKQ